MLSAPAAVYRPRIPAEKPPKQTQDLVLKFPCHTIAFFVYSTHPKASSYQFVKQTNLFNCQGDRFGLWTTDGGEVFCIKQAGNVGIGTNSPTAKLDVNGTAKASNFSGNGSGLTGVTDSSKVAKTGATMTGTLSVTASNAALTVPNGNVGIGTTNPTAKLQVEGNAQINGTIRGAGWGFGGMYTTNDDGSIISINPLTGGGHPVQMALRHMSLAGFKV